MMFNVYLKKYAFVTLLFFLWFTLGTGLVHTAEKENQFRKYKKIVAEKVKGENGTELSEKEETRETGIPNVIEMPAGKKKKKKKFPALLVVAGAVAVGIILYFILKKAKKKKYDLTVSIGEGVDGTPASGTYRHKEGEIVNYNYSLQAGYTNLNVLIDGQNAAESGSITMNQDHSISVTTQRVATLIVKSTPTGANICMDGTDTDKKTNHTFSFSSEGSHTIILRKLGYKEYETTVNAVFGQTTTVNINLEKGLKENFNENAESSILWKWEPYSQSTWAVSNGTYTGEANVRFFYYNLYNYNFSSSKYTVTVKMRRNKGDITGSNSVILASNKDATGINGYVFSHRATGEASATKLRYIDLENGGPSGGVKSLIFWKTIVAMNKGLGNYNTVKIVRDGGNYTYYVNDQLVGSFFDNAIDPEYIYVAGGSMFTFTSIEFDYVYIDVGNTSASVPGIPVSDTQDRGTGIRQY